MIKKCERKEKEFEELKIYYEDRFENVDKDIRETLNLIGVNNEILEKFKLRETIHQINTKSGLIHELKRITSSFKHVNDQSHLDSITYSLNQAQERLKKLREKKKN